MRSSGNIWLSDFRSCTLFQILLHHELLNQDIYSRTCLIAFREVMHLHSMQLDSFYCILQLGSYLDKNAHKGLKRYNLYVKVGKLDATVHVGLPDTMCSLWQQVKTYYNNLISWAQYPNAMYLIGSTRVSELSGLRDHWRICIWHSSVSSTQIPILWSCKKQWGPRIFFIFFFFSLFFVFFFHKKLVFTVFW